MATICHWQGGRRSLYNKVPCPEGEGRPGEKGSLHSEIPSSEGAKAGAGWGLYCEVKCIMGYGELKTLPSRNFAASLLCRSLCDALTRASV